MAKTRRNRRHKPAKQGNSTLAVIAPGHRVKVAGHRANPDEMVLSKDARPVFIGRVYSGVPRGKAYPYAGAKRGGAPA